MLPPSCARCGSPLPAVAADPTHPEWCGACAARALDAAGLPPAVPSASNRASAPPWNNPTTSTDPNVAAPVVVQTRVLDGILTGIAASVIGGLVWWGAVTAVSKSSDVQLWHLGSVIVGLFVGFGVLLGTRRGGLVSGLLALVFASVTVLVTVYFIDRSQTIIALTDAGRTSDVPLWQGVSDSIDIYRSWWDYEQSKALMWLAGPLVAVLIAGWPNRRPLGR